MYIFSLPDSCMFHIKVIKGFMLYPVLSRQCLLVGFALIPVERFYWVDFMVFCDTLDCFTWMLFQEEDLTNYILLAASVYWTDFCSIISYYNRVGRDKSHDIKVYIPLHIHTRMYYKKIYKYPLDMSQ